MSTGQFSLTDAQPVPSAGGSGRFRLADAKSIAGGGGPDASGTKGAPVQPSNIPKAPGGAPQPTAAQLGYDPMSSHLGGMAREATLGGLSGLTGMGEHTNPLEAAKGSMEGDLGFQIGQHIAGDPNAPGYLDMVKQHNPFAQAISAGQNLYGAGKEIATGQTPEDVAHGAGSFVGQLLQLSSLMKGGEAVSKVPTKPVTEAARLIERHNAINDAQTAVVNNQVRKPLALLDAKISDQIGKQVDPVLRADELHMKMTGSQVGYVSGADAAAAAQKASSKIGGDFSARVGNLIDRAQQPMTLRDVKALTTEVGKWMANTKDAREGKVLGDLYEGLHDASANRADDLGQAYAKAWKNYIDQARSWNEMKRGVAGDLMDDSAKHSVVLDKLINPDNSTEVSAIAKKMKQYGLDPKPLTAAREIGTDLSTSSEQTRNAFIGKIRAIQKYPIAAGAGAAGAAFVGSMSRIPGASFILPLLIAGRIGGMLDMAHIKTILADVKRNNPPESFDPHATYQVESGQWRSGEAKPGAIPPEASGAPAPSERGGPTAPPRPGLGAPTPSAASPTASTSPGEKEDMDAAQSEEESRQLMARQISRTKRTKKP